MLLPDDPRYPRRIARLAGAPRILFVRGALPSSPMVAIVGSRSATPADLDAAQTLAAELVASGFAILSGGAIGVDAAAHQGALDHGGSTVAVLGSGLDQLYPPRHLQLFGAISEQGALISPFAPGEPPRAWHFARRNQIIAAWADAVVVIAAGVRSGALNTARHARLLEVPLLARPGSAGPARLLCGGARPLRSAADVLVALGASGPAPEQPLPCDPDEAACLAALRDGARRVDELAERTGLRIARVATAVIRLELGGWVQPLADGSYSAIGATDSATT